MASDPNLWGKAFNSLTPELQKSLDPVKTHKRDVLAAVLKEAETKRALSLRKRWKFTKPNGDVIIVRDVLEKIVGWVQRFKDTGDIIVQYEPTHAALPWAAVRFLLQVSVSEVQVFAAMADDLENISRIMARYRLFEVLYLRGAQSELELKLEEALSGLYAEILVHLGSAVKFFEERSTIRLLKSPFRAVDEERAKELLRREHEVNDFAKLADAETIRSLEVAFVRLSTHISRSLTEDKYNDILEWLSVAPYYHHHQFIAQMRLPGAGRWLLSHEDYIQWQSSSSPSLLLFHGIPGSGKSTLCSVVVDSLLSIASTTPSAAPLAYFYCANPESEKARCSSDDTMRSILFQLCINATHPTQMRDILSSEYERQRARSRAGKMDMPRLRTKDCVRLILELAEQDPMTIVIDGLDSVEDSERPDLIDALREIVSHADNVVKVFVTSRSSHRAAAMPIAEFQIQVTSQETRPDMEAFVEHSVDDAVARKLLLEGNLRPEIRRMLLHALLDGAGEMFLWVKLQLQRICRKTVEDDVVSALQDKLPEDIDQLYKESLAHILTSGDMARDIAVKVLSWVLYMREPLTPIALLGAATAGEHSTLDLNQLMVLCANLVIMDTKCNIIRFAHQSVQDFLQRQAAFAAASAHSLLASACLGACLRGPDTAYDQGLKIPSDDFYVYAAMHWPVHAEKALAVGTDTASTNSLRQNVTTFIFDEEWETTLPFDSWISSIREISKKLPKYHVLKPILETIPGSESGFLFLLSTFGLSDILDAVLSNIGQLNINIQNEIGHTPLYLAAAFGHLKSITTLVSRGANINVECGRYGSPLHVASFSGHLNAVDLLLQLGAIITCGSVFENALQAAFRGGREDVALFLVGVDSAFGSEDDKEKALQDAAFMGFVRVVQKLHVELSGLTSSSKGKIDKIKRQVTKAIQGGQVGILRQFLGHNVGNRDLVPPDAIAIATLHNHKTMVEFLLTHGLDLEAAGAFGTPLRTASLLNYESIARLLLDRGADIDASRPLSDALQAAALNGHVSIMRLLLQEGANVNQRTGFYGSALQAAAYHGQADAVELLMDYKADAYRSGHSSDAFHAAIEGGHPDVTAMLLRKCGIYHETHLPKRGYCLSLVNYKNLLRDASPERRKLRGQAKGSPETRMDEPWTTKRPIVSMETIFQIASSEFDVTQLEFEKASYIGYYLDSPLLHAAASCGHEETVKLLLKHQDGRDTSNKNITRAIEFASQKGHLHVAHVLADHISNQTSVDKRVKDKLAWTSLMLASEPFFAEEITSLQNKLSSITKKPRRVKSDNESLLQDFTVCCRRGDVGSATAMLGTERHKLLSRDEVEGGLQLCAFHGHNTLLQFLLDSPCLRNRIPQSGGEILLAAASNGFVNTMKLVTSHWKELLLPSMSAILSHALTLSSEKSHIDAVRYLVMELGADVNARSPHTDVKLKLENVRRPGVLERRYSQIQWEYQRGPAERGVISPLQAAMNGIANIPRKVHSISCPKNAENHWEEIIIFLLESGSSVDDPGGQNVLPIQMAAKYCSENVLQCLVSAGANVNALLDSSSGAGQFASNNSALFRAAGRELLAFPAVSSLVEVGAVIPEDAEGQNELIDQALRYFRANYHSRKDNGCFELSPSLEYVFSKGPGAVLFFFLSRMPNIETTDIGWTLVLQMSAFLNQGSLVDVLLSRGTDVNSIGHYYGTALQAAARCGHDAMVRQLLKAGAKVHFQGGKWETALQAALVGGHESTAKLLLSHGAAATPYALNTQDSNGLGAEMQTISNPVSNSQAMAQSATWTNDLDIVKAFFAKRAGIKPLILAAGMGQIEVVENLINTGESVNIQGWKFGPFDWDRSVIDASPIHAASAAGHLSVVKLLLSRGADIELTVRPSKTPLWVAACHGQAAVVRLLLSAGAMKDDNEALMVAVQGGHIEVVQELLVAGGRASEVLSLAYRHKNLEVTALLIENAMENVGAETVLDEAFAIKDLDDSVARLLLDHATPSVSQFFQCCASGSTAAVKAMLERQIIDVNQPSKATGDYPLQVAALNLRPEVVQILLLHGANVECESSNHGTPLITALEVCVVAMLRKIGDSKIRHFMDTLSPPAPQAGEFYFQDPPPTPSCLHVPKCEIIVKLLVEHGANVVSGERRLGSPLQLACLIGCTGMVEWLMKRSGNIHTTVGYFEKPLFAAIQGKHLHIVSLLLQQTPLEVMNHVHTEYGTALHHAYRSRAGKIARELLRHGADATIADSQGLTALSIALQEGIRLMNGGVFPVDTGNTMSSGCIIRPSERLHISGDSIVARFLNSESEDWTPCGKDMEEMTLIDSLPQLARLHISGEDLVTAAIFDIFLDEDNKVFGRLLSSNETLKVTEHTVCRILQLGTENQDSIELLMHKNGGIGVTKKMLRAVRDLPTLRTILEFRPVAKITPDILVSQQKLACMGLLLDFDSEVHVTDAVISRAFELQETHGFDLFRNQETEDVFEILLERKPQISGARNMPEEVSSVDDTKVFLAHVEAGTRIAGNALDAISKLQDDQRRKMLQQLVDLGGSIEPTNSVVEDDAEGAEITENEESFSDGFADTTDDDGSCAGESMESTENED